jgi:hypothetical protein
VGRGKCRAGCDLDSEGLWFDRLTTGGSTGSPQVVRQAHHRCFDRLTTGASPKYTAAPPTSLADLEGPRSMGNINPAG